MVRILVRMVRNYWMETFKTYAPFGLNIEVSVWPIPCRSVNVTGWLTFLEFIGILVRPVTDLRQDVLDMTYVFLLFIVLFISLLLIILCNMFLRYVLFWYYVLVLFQLPGASYSTDYLFIIPIDSIVTLNSFVIM